MRLRPVLAPMVFSALLVALPEGAAAAPINITGTFVSTNAACGSGSVVCSGVGTSGVSWGTPVAGTALQSSLLFTPNAALDAAPLSPGDIVTLGTLQFVNGTAELGTWINSATLVIDTDGFADDLSITINTINTLCVGGESPQTCADYIHFQNSNHFGSFGVFEGFYGTVEVKGLIGSLHLAGFGNVTGVGLAFPDGTLGLPIDPTVLPPELQAGFISSTVPGVPEPGAALLVGLGVGLLWLRGLRRVQP